MADDSKLAAQLQKAVEDMTTTQKGMVAAIALTVLLVLVGFGLWASQESMGVLFSNLPPTDANRIVEELKKGNIKYELSTDQRTVSVPEARVGDLRLKFAGDGLPKGEGIGFEKLENPSLTTTDFTQKIMYRRALESQLAKTIMSLQQVSEAVVHITPSNDSPFVTEKEEAKASVLLKLKGARQLPDENAQAIVNLVAASVEGLKPESVVIIDQFSRILSHTGMDPMAGATDSQKKSQREEEDHLVQEVTALLEPVVGLGKVRATARVELDFDKVHTNEEKFDPQGQVERETKVIEDHESKNNSTPNGVPGTASNVAPANAGVANATSNDIKDHKENDTHFEISKSVSSTDKAPGSVKRMSIAVIVDHASHWGKDAKGEPVETLVARTPEELQKFKDQVSAAVGFQPKRGDELTVENLPFASVTNPKEEKEAQRERWVSMGRELAPNVIYLLIGLVVFFLIILPLLKRISQALVKPVPLRVHVADGGDGEGGEGGSHVRKYTPMKSVAELEAEIEAELNAEGASSAPDAQRRSLIKKRIQESTLGDPETVASLVRSWMIEDGDKMAKLTGTQKAAVLMVTLGDETASNIFKFLEEDEIQNISKEIALTKHVQPETADDVMEEFYTMSLAKTYIAQGGIEYAKKLLIKSVGPEAARKIIDRLTKALESSAGFSSIERANPAQLSKFIQNEHPQTIALILAHLNASQAGDLIASLPETLRADVAMRMANLQEISPEVVRRISLILEQKLEALGSFATEAYGGVRAVAELFNRMDRTTGRVVLEKIENENPQLAASIRDLMFVFDDILLIDDLGIAEILKRVDKKSLTTALKGTSDELRNQFFRNMSSRAVELMKEEMEFMGPIKLKDVEKAQHEIVEIVRQLEEEGVISIGGGGGDDYVS